MKKDELNTFIEKLKTDIQFNFDKDEFIAPVFLFINNDFEIQVLNGNVETLEAKELLTSYVIPTKKKKIKASVIITISEAWIKEFSKEEAKKVDLTKKAVSEYDDKIEIVMLNIETANETTTIAWKIVRPENEKPYLEDYKTNVSKYPDIQGRYTNFLHAIQANQN